jgi:NAD(P)-dependent dehydrogenase (short-subunit alcohol dehydrogenase family)
VEDVRVDLATDEGVDALYGEISSAGRPVDAIALNAGIGAGGAFATGTDLDDELWLIDLNVRFTLHLAKHVLRDMVSRDEGRILFSSIASRCPAPSRPCTRIEVLCAVLRPRAARRAEGHGRDRHLAHARTDRDAVLRARRHA